ncbi:4'-phosphopantetheinyl transferase superfamily protein [Streptomyces sp. NPDC035033]|uniref:4'-phosphopantetheinyl transferase family protein n=1 Tax=Streptomyces sp. NPDC035033 TaxID=3155368 RepID=UPI00340D0D94
MAVAEALGDAGPAPASPYPEEHRAVARAVDRRRREFFAVRACARRAMEALGVPPAPVLPDGNGAPGWPPGLIGSMTHCAGYRAAALARSGGPASLGIDAEPHGPLPDGVLSHVARPAERDRLTALAARHPAVHWDRLLFSAKESVYKAWYPLTGRWLEFHQADIEIHPPAGPAAPGRFGAVLLVPGPVVGGRRLQRFEGRWTVRHGLAATAVTVPAGTRTTPTARYFP